MRAAGLLRLADPPDSQQLARMVMLCELVDETGDIRELWYDPADHSHYFLIVRVGGMNQKEWFWHDTIGQITEGKVYEEVDYSHSYHPNQLDITAPRHGVQVEVEQKRGVVYVHVDGVTALRVCRIPGQIEVKIDRPVCGMREQVPAQFLEALNG